MANKILDAIMLSKSQEMGSFCSKYKKVIGGAITSCVNVPRPC